MPLAEEMVASITDPTGPRYTIATWQACWKSGITLNSGACSVALPVGCEGVRAILSVATLSWRKKPR